MSHRELPNARRSFATAACVFLATVSAPRARAQSEIWHYPFPGTTVIATGLAVDEMGASLFSGATHLNFQPVSRFLTRFDFDGHVVWTYVGPPGPTLTQGYRVSIDPQGDVLAFDRAVGSTLYFQKHSGVDGSLLWTSAIPQVGATVATYVRAIFDGQGGTWLLVHYAPIGLNNRSTVLKLDAAGNVVWDTFAGAWNTFHSASLAFEHDAQGNVYYEESPNLNELRLAQVDATGAVTWTYRYVDPRGPVTLSCGFTIDAQDIVHQYLVVPSANATVEVRIDSAGQLVGAQDVTPQVSANAFDALDGNIALSFAGPANGQYGTSVRDAAGNERWRQSFSVLPGEYAMNSVRLDALGGVLLHSFVDNLQPPSNARFENRRYDASGHLLWNSANVNTAGAPIGPDSAVVLSTGANSVTLLKLGFASNGFCFGDGLLAACPCANSSATTEGAGCRNSQGLGAQFAGSGNPSLAADALSLDASHATGGLMVIFQGSGFEANARGTAFGDGLLCVGGSLVRIASRPLSAGSLHYPQSGDASISVRGNVAVAGTRTYQGIYRNAAAFCTPATLNATNGVVVHWQP